MDFIERIFGVSPDGGSGSFEIALLVIPLTGLVLLYAWHRNRARQRRRHDK